MAKTIAMSSSGKIVMVPSKNNAVAHVETVEPGPTEFILFDNNSPNGDADGLYFSLDTASQPIDVKVFWGDGNSDEKLNDSDQSYNHIYTSAPLDRAVSLRVDDFTLVQQVLINSPWGLNYVTHVYTGELTPTRFPNLTLFNVEGNPGLGAVDITPMTGLETCNVDTCGLSVLSLTGLTVLSDLSARSNSLTTLDVIGTNLQTLNAQFNSLPSGEVDQILMDLDTIGRTFGNVNLSGGSNAARTSASDAAVISLTGKSWTVTTT